MFSLIKFSIYFAVSFIILSFPVNNKTIFGHLNGYSRPYTDKIFNTITINAENLFNKGSDASKKLFTNTKPKNTKIDKVKMKRSSIRKDIEHAQEKYTIEEQEMIRKILEKSQ